MTIDGDHAAWALAGAWEHFTVAMAEAWMVREDGALAGVTGVPLPTLNRVWVDETGAAAKAVEMLLNQVAATGLPHCLQLRPGCDRALGELAARRGMTPSDDVPLMVLEDAESIAVAEPTDLLIRPLALRTPAITRAWQPLASKRQKSTSSNCLPPASTPLPAFAATWVSSTASRSPLVSESHSATPSASSTSSRSTRTGVMATAPLSPLERSATD
jgi:hypothetical protein